MIVSSYYCEVDVYAVGPNAACEQFCDMVYLISFVDLLLVGCERGGVAHRYRSGRVTAGSRARVQVGHDHYHYLDEDGEQFVQRNLWTAESWLVLAKFVQDNRPTAEALDCAIGSM